MQMTVILNNRGCELDRVYIKAGQDDITSDDLAEAIRKANGGQPWILGDCDTLIIVEDTKMNKYKWKLLTADAVCWFGLFLMLFFKLLTPGLALIVFGVVFGFITFARHR